LGVNYRRSLEEHVEYLSVSIGPRPSTREGEAQAAEYVGDVMRRLTVRNVRLERFRSGSSTYRPFALAFSAALLGTCLYSVFPEGVPAATAAGLNAVGAWGMYAETDFINNWMRLLLPRAWSQNVVGEIPARKERRRRVVLLAHLDTHRTPIFYSTLAWQKAFRALVGLCFLSMAVSGALYLAAAAIGWPLLRWAAAPLGGLQVFGLIMCVHADLTHITPGANDNASGVAVLLTLAARLTQTPLMYTDVWAVATGCEEVGAYGVGSLLDAHGDELREAYLLALDQVAAGEVTSVTSDGLIRKHASHEELLSLVREVAREHPGLGVKEHTGVAYTDATVVNKRRFRGMAIVAQPTANVDQVHWHQISDTMDKVRLDTLQRTHSFVWALLQKIDSIDRGNPAGHQSPSYSPIIESSSSASWWSS